MTSGAGQVLFASFIFDLSGALFSGGDFAAELMSSAENGPRKLPASTARRRCACVEVREMGALLLTLLVTQSAAFGGHRARTLPFRHRVSPPVACANEDLISKMCAYEADEERRAAMEAVFAEWPAGSHDSKGDEVVAAISKRIGETQTAALAAHGRGEDTV